MKKLLAILAILSLSGFVYASDGDGHGDGDGNGNTTVGPAGPQGPQGPQGPAGSNGTNGTNGANGSNGQNGKDGKNGINATQTVNRAFKGEIDARLWDTQHTSFYLFESYGFDDSPTHDFVMDGRNSSYGFKFVIKLGTSYEERKLDDQAKQIKALETALARLSN